MRRQLVESLESRLIVEIGIQNPLKYLKAFQVDNYVDTAIATIYMYTRPKKGNKKDSPLSMVEVISAIGHAVRSKLKLKKDSSLAAKTGAFILWSFEDLGMTSIALQPGSNKHATYVVVVLNDANICKLFEGVTHEKIEKLPSETPYAPWTSWRHETGARLVKTSDKGVLEALTPDDHPIIFATVNRPQTIGWCVNKEVFDVQTWALRNRTDAFADIWEQQNPEAKTTKLREAKAIGSIAKRFLHKTFYHLYYYDFRGRKYPTTAYLHEQGTDLARALIRRADGKPMTEDGFFWLMVVIGSYWAGDAGRQDALKTDKIQLKARFDWATDHEDTLFGYAESPKLNQGWMKADKPWQFLAACFELRKLRMWQVAKAHSEGLNAWDCFEDFSYVTHFEAYIDGSNNGSQHLAALTRDEITAPHVNLVPSEYPGDLYKYVGDDVWEGLQELAKDYTEDDYAACEALIAELLSMKRQIQLSEPRSEKRKMLVEQIKHFKSLHENMLTKAGVVYWLMVTDAKHKRKIVKRNVMTLPYGGTSYGLGQQVIDDSKKHGIELLLYLEHKWGAFLGREVFQTCRRSLKRPMQLLSVFEQAGKAAEARGEFLSWTVPVTNFPVVQHYTEGVVKKLYVQYGPPMGVRRSTGYYDNTLQLAVCFIEDMQPSVGRQASGASPNCIHSLDAAHLALTVYNCDFPITTIHDSFGALLPDMPKLYKVVRESFVELYETDPLTTLMTQIKGDMTNVELGTLDIRLFLESEYGFS